MAKKIYSSSNLGDLRRRAERAMERLKHSDNPGLLAYDEISRLLHELNVHKIELEIQNDELRDSQERLQASRDKYADLYEFGPVAYITFNKNHRIIETNLTTCRILKLDKNRIIGMTMDGFLASSDIYMFRQHLVEIF